jgi:hypothetical protein
MTTADEIMRLAYGAADAHYDYGKDGGSPIPSVELLDALRVAVESLVAERDAARAALSAPAVPQWILVSEQQAPESTDILFFSPDLRNPVSMLLGRCVAGSFMCAGFEMVNVTHWALPPAAPSAKESPKC